jgi:hypothetical protein
MKYWMFEHQDKGQAFKEAFDQKGWEKVSDVRNSDAVIIDFDWHWHTEITQAFELDIPIFQYIHSPSSWVYYDGLLMPSEKVTHRFSITDASRHMMRVLGVPGPITSVGFPYAKLGKFERTIGEKVLFAPLHPDGDLYLDDDLKQENSQTFKALLDAGAQITVSCYGGAENCGLWINDRVKYLRSPLSIQNMLQMIRVNDLVVADETPLYLAVAVGKPAIGLAGRLHPHQIGHPDLILKTWPDYKDDYIYPIQAGDFNMSEMIKYVTRNNVAKFWRDEWIGHDFNELLALDIIEGYV